MSKGLPRPSDTRSETMLRSMSPRAKGKVNVSEDARVGDEEGEEDGEDDCSAG